MKQYDCDLFVVGGGSGGVRAARRASGYGARVVMAESGPLGGTCVNLGCIPKKIFHHASAVRAQAVDAAGFGYTVSPTPPFDWRTLVANKDKEIARLNAGYDSLLRGAGVEVLHGAASLAGPHEVHITDASGAVRSLSAACILLAVGSEATRPTDAPGWVSDDLFHLESLPRRVAVFGGGYIATEFASIFNGLGVETTLVNRSKRVLRGFEETLVSALLEEMVSSGIRLRLEAEYRGSERAGDGTLSVSLSDGGAPLAVDGIVWAIGRHARVEGLGLEALGILCNARGKIETDASFQTACESVYALGDAGSRGVELTPVALAEGEAFAANRFKGEKRVVDYARIPSAAFTHPPLARVGLTAEEARATDPGAQTWRTRFRPLHLALSERGEQVELQLTAGSDGKLLGFHMLGEVAPEVIQAFGLALTAGATCADLAATLSLHPTLAEEFLSLPRDVEAV